MGLHWYVRCTATPMPSAPLPPSVPAAPFERTFALRGLGVRDATVFKSMVKLLAGKTRDRWTCVDNPQADLLVVSGNAPVQAAAGQAAPRPGTQQVIRVEAAERGARADALVLPLRAEEVCAQLDRAGERLAAIPPRSVPVTCRLQLTRWPSALLLFTRLAGFDFGTGLALRRRRGFVLFATGRSGKGG